MPYPSETLFPSNILYPGLKPNPVIWGRGNLEQKLREDAMLIHPYPVRHHDQIVKDDDEIMELISMVMNAGLL